jgi:hypothetical protein
MLSQPATKIFFKTSEPRAAKWISEAIGEIEVERLKESRNLGLLRSKKSYAMEIAIKPLVMASEISGLESLRGFIKQENRVVPVWFQLTTKRNQQPEFIERKPAFPPKPVETTVPSTKRPVSSTAPEKPARSLPPSQAAIPFDARAESRDKDEDRDRETEKSENDAGQGKEGFVWDKSKAIN